MIEELTGDHYRVERWVAITADPHRGYDREIFGRSTTAWGAMELLAAAVREDQHGIYRVDWLIEKTGEERPFATYSGDLLLKEVAA